MLIMEGGLEHGFIDAAKPSDGLCRGAYMRRHNARGCLICHVNKYGDRIPELFGRIYSEWFPSSGYEKIEGWDMEIYGVYPDSKKYEEVWVPVKKK